LDRAAALHRALPKADDHEIVCEEPTMVIVYLKNGEKAPLPDANDVRLVAGDEKAGITMLRCYFGEHEVGVFRWEEVAGYSIDAPMSHSGASSGQAYEAWGVRQGT
jgi:hypothetical protein